MDPCHEVRLTNALYQSTLNIESILLLNVCSLNVYIVINHINVRVRPVGQGYLEVHA